MSGAGQVAIVTGRSGGIGREAVLRLAASGYDVVASYSSSEKEAQVLVDESNSLPGTVVIMRANVADAADVAAPFDKAENQFGGVDVLVTAAGMFKPVSFAEADEAHFDREMAVNLRGTFLCLVEAAKRLRDGGRIVAISSTTLALKPRGYGIYNAAKGAIEAMITILPRRSADAISPPIASLRDLSKPSSSSKGRVRMRTPRAPRVRLRIALGIPKTLPTPSNCSFRARHNGSTARACAQMEAWHDRLHG